MPKDNPTFPGLVIEQAGAVVYKIQDGNICILTIRPKKNPSQRIFPKGHVEYGETDSFAAQRELLEEAGVAGEWIGFGGIREFFLGEKHYRIKYHVFRFGSVVHGGEAGRDPLWCSVERTIEMLPYPDLKDLLMQCLPVIRLKEGLLPEVL